MDSLQEGAGLEPSIPLASGVTGPLETFANAAGVHLARAILAEFAENVAKLVAEQAAAESERVACSWA